MTDAITVKDATKQRLKPGTYVRIQSSGVYKGDLAQVVNVETGGSCMVKVVPRVDLTALAKRCACALKSCDIGGPAISYATYGIYIAFSSSRLPVDSRERWRDCSI